MDLPSLITALSSPNAYPESVESVEVRQTHISVVFLAGSHAYKVKKPVSLGFVDFSTLERRRHFCEEENRLNQRLAPGVYEGVVAITRGPDGVKIGGRGEAVEWAVKMERMPPEASLADWLRRGELNAGHLGDVARRIAAFHAEARSGPEVSAWGRFEVVADNARQNFEQARPQVGTSVSRAVFERTRELTERALGELGPLIESRALRGMPSDGHGDLRLDHVYLFPDRRPPADLVVIDCIEFDERFRCADPVADVAFPVMDLTRAGRRDLAEAFASAYFCAVDDPEGRKLLPFYTAYRAVVRGKVEGMELLEPEVPESERAAVLPNARAHWLVALSELEGPGSRPCMVLMGGLPGTGKTTLAERLANDANLTVIRSDVVRKRLARIRPDQRAASDFGEDIYAPEWTDRTYKECLAQAEAAVFNGQRVLIDASFQSEATRRQFLDAARRWTVPVVMLICQAEPDVVRERLQQRQNDASDADWQVYQQAAARWEALSPLARSVAQAIDTSQGTDASLTQALAALAERVLHGTENSGGATTEMQ
jgi:aminoglycoside phosphotransferase family enzyme/predicted kinase